MLATLKAVTLCAISAALGIAVFISMNSRRPVDGLEVAGAPQGSLSWVRNVPVLGRIAASQFDDVSPGTARHDDVITADSLVALAANDPSGAIRDATRLEGYWLRRDTLERIAAAWASKAPAEALAYITASRDLGNARRSLLSLVLDEWARANPGGALDYLTGPVGSELFFIDQSTASRAARIIADADPYLVLTKSDAQSSPYVRSLLRQSAIPVIAERDPEFAESRIQMTASESEAADWRAAIALIGMQGSDANPVPD